MGKPPNTRALSASTSAPAASSQRALAVFSVAAALVLTVGAVPLGALWDPPELETAEIGRRIAHDLLGARGLEAPNDPPLPTQGELGRGELPFTSIALGFRLFGLSTWAGRLPLALWALAGLAALFFLVRRLSGARAAWVSVLALVSMPLYFVQARSLLGDIVLMASSAFAMAGLGVAVFDNRESQVRWAGLLLALIGLLAGFYTRGLWLGVGVPTLGVGVAWLVLRLSSATSDRTSTLIGAFSLCGGVLAATLGTLILQRTPSNAYSIWNAAVAGGVHPLPAFDVILRELGHAAFPWSALCLPALGRLLAPPLVTSSEAQTREQGLRLLLVASAASALFAQTALAPEVGVIPFSAPAALAAACAIALLDLERGAATSRLFGLSVAAFLLLLLLDFRNFPEKGLCASGVPDAIFPPSFAARGFAWLALATLPCAVLFFFLVAEAGTLEADGAFDVAEYARWPRLVRRLWSGNFWFALSLLGILLLGLDLLGVLSERVLHLAVVERLGELPRSLVRVGWLLVLAVCVAPALVLAGRDGVRWGLDLPQRLALRCGRSMPRLSRGMSAALVFSLAGLWLGLGYFPELMAELSPQGAFAAYRREARAQEPLAVLGVSSRVARYQTQITAAELRDADEAVSYLTKPGARRFIALRADELPSLNAAYRASTEPHVNVPILASGSRAVLLASNQLTRGAPNDNPLSRSVLDVEPHPAHRVEAELGVNLRVLGWDVFDEAGAPTEAVSAGREYEFVIYYRVLERLVGNWDTFFHIDGFQRRYNGDHPTLEGHYPFSLWLPGDYIADRHLFRLGPEFSRGEYEVFFGLYSGSRRLDVRRGTHEENRIVAGKLTVR
jgi:hypothetical protein